MSDSKKSKDKSLRAEEAREDAAEDRAEERKEDLDEVSKSKWSNWERLTKEGYSSTPKALEAPFNAPRPVPEYFPRWVVASIPDVGDLPVCVKNAGEEAAVKNKSASFKVTKSAQGDVYEVLA